MLAKRVSPPVGSYLFALMVTGALLAPIPYIYLFVKDFRWFTTDSFGWLLPAVGALATGTTTVHLARRTARRLQRFKRDGRVHRASIETLTRRVTVPAFVNRDGKKIRAKYVHVAELIVTHEGEAYRAPPPFEMTVEVEPHYEWDYAFVEGAEVTLWVCDTPAGLDGIVVAIKDEDGDLVEIPL